MKHLLTLRVRVAVSVAAVTAVALVLLASGTWIYVYLEDLEAIDEHLVRETLEIRADLAKGKIEEDEFAADPFEPRLGLAVISSAGPVLGITPSFPIEVVDLGAADFGFSIQSGVNSRWRVYSTRREGVIFVIGHNLEEFDDVLSDLASIQILLVPLVSLSTAWISWLVAGRSLAPIREATETAANIGINDLTARLPIARLDDEIGQFTAVLNGMLDRIEKNYLQAKRFAGDASHELSTPLTIIKGELEKLVAKDSLPEAAEDGIISAQQEVDRMHLIIDQLLLLARFDAGKASEDFQPVDLSELVDHKTEDIDLLSAKISLKITRRITPGISIQGDSSQLHRLFLNLFSNATKYNTTQDSIDYELAVRDGFAHFSISNSGPTIPAADKEHIFERFFQVDESRAASGSGLGLSICLEIARAHGGTIELLATTRGFTKFLVKLPLLLAT